ncbi:two component transcriptional regulator [Pseudogulbenkiania sp. NH8B]|uniref:Two component transcriptional regulator, winged helix family n=1 Tax=Pseudogulbenkiania ferrooxidans 2002 TaxID=279714 RepID=B9Z5B7_9NEIS|nr:MULTISPECIES: two-component system response regulator OmpR [Pseudogulbenkiania]EEG07764.1 two component transcriptional regulator, winged helix family [Pseudogulbenkiania ferrooxidans 2002]BAK74895.1 two component transcriptional regulator [Pseudogulbenkiania sp. NH8B]
MENSKILVVDDDAKLRDLLVRYLGQQGYTVDTLPDARELQRKLARNRPDLMVLDVMMPGEDGLAVVRRLRAQGEMVPVIMLTARGEDIDRILGLEMGADDYLPKPFNPRELVARIQSVLRRHNATPALAARHEEGDAIEFGPFTLHLGRRELTHQDKVVTLTSAEYAVLAVLASHPRRPMTREQLMEMALGKGNGESLDRSIDVHISRLRRALDTDEGGPRYIQTVWGYGYVFVPDGAPRE